MEKRNDQKREKIFLAIFSMATSLNLLMVRHIHTTGDIRDSWKNNYVLPFTVFDIVLFIAGTVLLYWVGIMLVKKIVPWLRSRMMEKETESNERLLEKCSKVKIFACIFSVWFFFFLVFYPETAMNDTIFILEDPLELSRQHPLFYVIYTYGLFKVGSLLGKDPNSGLALISLVQMLAMAYVLSDAITLLADILREREKNHRICGVLILYFSFAPLFFTYAFSAIKDTPFSICMFYMILLLYRLKESKGKILSQIGYRLQLLGCILGVAGFRSNGLLVAVGTLVIVGFVYREFFSKLATLWLVAMGMIFLLNVVLKPEGVDRLLQESFGMQIQQVGAIAAKGMLTEEQEKYLYKLLPKEKWENYAPSCADVLKWDAEFDREFLNATGSQFLSIWWKLMWEHPDEYIKAFLMNTYGFWGIETRNNEQYYQKDIWENTLGLYQESPLPDMIWKLFYRIYCNRFTYRYLSAGTTFWVLCTVILWLIYRRDYRLAVIFAPVVCNFLTLFLTTPIAFAFRYVFIIAMLFPFYILLPFITENKEKKELLYEDKGALDSNS